MYDGEGAVKGEVAKNAFCFRCDKTARKGTLIRCDFCPLYWHLDCLDPPLTSAPLPMRKWKCPNHADHSLVRLRVLHLLFHFSFLFLCLSMIHPCHAVAQLAFSPPSRLDEKLPEAIGIGSFNRIRLQRTMATLKSSWTLIHL